MEYLTREQSATIIGEKIMEQVDSLHCDFTGRLTEGTKDNGFTEFSASYAILNLLTINAYYYQKNEYLEGCEDLSNLEWIVDHYTIS
jgi:hypothetical protein